MGEQEDKELSKLKKYKSFILNLFVMSALLGVAFAYLVSATEGWLSSICGGFCAVFVYDSGLKYKEFLMLKTKVREKEGK